MPTPPLPTPATGPAGNVPQRNFIGPWETPLARIRHIAKTLTAVADLLDSYRPPTTPN